MKKLQQKPLPGEVTIEQGDRHYFLLLRPGWTKSAHVDLGIRVKTRWQAELVSGALQLWRASHQGELRLPPAHHLDRHIRYKMPLLGEAIRDLEQAIQADADQETIDLLEGMAYGLAGEVLWDACLLQVQQPESLVLSQTLCSLKQYLRQEDIIEHARSMVQLLVQVGKEHPHLVSILIA